MTAAFNIELVLRAQAAQAKQELAAVKSTLDEVGEAGRRGQSGAAATAAGLQATADAAERAAKVQARLAAEARAYDLQRQRETGLIRDGSTPFHVMADLAAGQRAQLAILRTSTTASAELGAAIAGANRDIAKQGVNWRETAEDARNYRAALDDIRASYNPLFAASRQYEHDLDRIAAAERLGAISAREAADARAAAAARLGPATTLGARAGAPSWITGNLAAQGNDIMMMAIAGQNPLQLALQQGTQVSQVLNGLEKGTSIPQALAAGFMSMINPVSMLTIGLVALGAVGIQALGKLLPPTKSLSEAVGGLSASVDRYGQTLAQLRSNDLAAKFGSSAAAARELISELAIIERRMVELDTTASMRAISDNLKSGWVQTALNWDSPQFMKMFDIGRFDTSGLEKAGAVQAAARDAMEANGLDNQIAALETLVDLWAVAAEHSGKVTTEENEQARLIASALADLYKLRGLEENAPGQAAASAMADDLGRQAAMQAAITRYGQESAAVRMLELQQQKAITAEKLKALGIGAQSADALRIEAELQLAHDQREQAIRDARRLDHEDQLTALERERALVGATTAERIRATAVAEAELAARNQSLSPLERALEITRAITRAESEARLEREKAAHELQTGYRMDALDAQLGLARDPLTRAELEGEREYVRLMADGADAAYARAQADRVRAKSLGDALTAGRSQIAQIGDEVAVRQQVAAQVAAGTIAAADANRAIQKELELRPLVAAAARAEGAEKQQLTEIITGLRIAYEMQAAEERRQAQNDYLRASAERLAQARLELVLVGQTAEVRGRVLAMIQAERDIREQGLSGAAAEQVRREAAELVRLNLEIQAQADAWTKVQSAGEAAIDAVLDKLRGGDVKGAIAGMLDELNKGFFDLAIRNPLKNAILGTNLGTLDQIGGFQGIMDRLSGRSAIDERSVIDAAARPVQAMTVSAAQVTINAGSIAGDALGLLGLGSAANFNAAPMTAMSGVQAQIWNFFAGKGLAAHQVAGIMGNIAGESAFNPYAHGDYRNGVATSYGLFQHHAGRGQGLLEAVGGMSGLGNVQAQLEYVWQELLTTERAALERLKSAPTVGAAADAWMRGFERPSEKAMASSGAKRAAAAEAAMAQFGTSAQAAAGAVGQMGQTAGATTGQLGQMGQGMGQFGSALQQIIGGALTGGKSGALGGLLSLGARWLDSKLPQFDIGGYTGGHDPSQIAGVVHGQEYVFSAPAVRKIGARNLDALHKGSLRGFASGGYVSSLPMPQGPDNGTGPGGGIIFAPSFDLRGASDPDEVERAARRGMKAVIEQYDSQLPRRFREIAADGRAV